MFAVSRFKNRNGVFSFRVDGQLNGVRIRRNFKSQEEAAAEKGVLELKALQLASRLCKAPTKRISRGNSNWRWTSMSRSSFLRPS